MIVFISHKFVVSFFLLLLPYHNLTTYLMMWKIIVAFFKPNSEKWNRDKQKHGNEKHSSSNDTKTLRAAEEAD